MSDSDLVIRFIEKLGVSEAAKQLGISRPTVYARIKNPETVTLRELSLVKSINAAENPQPEPVAMPKSPLPADKQVTAEDLPEQRFRPATPKTPTSQGASLENLAERVQSIEEYLRIVSTNKALMSGKPAVGESIPTPRPAFSGEHPLTQLQRAGNPQDKPTRPKGLRPEFDTGWLTPKNYNKDTRP